MGVPTTARNRTWLVPVAIAVLLVLVIIGGLAAIAVMVARSTTPRPALRYATAPGTDPGTGDTPTGGHGQQVDSISCGPVEQKVSHVHAHLFILKDGVAQPVSALVGIPGTSSRTNCFYWLHTHDRSGIIHIEAPDENVHTLGEFFDIWGMPLRRDQVARIPAGNDALAIFVDGTRYTGDPTQIPLTRHTQVVIEVGKEVPPPDFAFTGY